MSVADSMRNELVDYIERHPEVVQNLWQRHVELFGGEEELSEDDKRFIVAEEAIDANVPEMKKMYHLVSDFFT